ncbi:hypothetical protein BC940DRAFT_312864, partial [Gongronella butleri]
MAESLGHQFVFIFFWIVRVDSSPALPIAWKVFVICCQVRLCGVGGWGEAVLEKGPNGQTNPERKIANQDGHTVCWSRAKSRLKLFFFCVSHG